MHSERTGAPLRMAWAVVAVLAVAVTHVPEAQARDTCQTKRCVERVARKQCSQTRVIPCIRRAALHRGQSTSDMVRVARCESTLNPYATNGVHRGLFQFNWPGTWNTTPYSMRDPFSAKWNALAAAWMWEKGRRSEWQCR